MIRDTGSRVVKKKKKEEEKQENSRVRITCKTDGWGTNLGDRRNGRKDSDMNGKYWILIFS